MTVPNWKRTLRQIWNTFTRFVERWLPEDKSEVQTRTREVEPIEASSWQRAMDRWQEEFRATLDHFLPARWLPEGQPAQDAVLAPFGGGIGPAIEVEETDTDIIVRAEIPGLKEKDFRVEVTGRRLVIRGQKTATAEEHTSGYYRSERRYGAFARAIPLPCEIESDRAQATYQSGVLRVTLPKTEQAQATRVTVEVR